MEEGGFETNWKARARRAARGAAALAFVLPPLAACQTLYTDVLMQDDPAYIVEVEPRYRLPFPNTPDGFVLIQGVGGHFSHRGRLAYSFDWAMPRGTPVLAARGGTVEYVEESFPEEQSLPLRLRRANLLKVRHDDGTVAVYAHLSAGGVHVEAGDRVEAGEYIADSGNTGFSTEPHLHFHVEDDRGRAIPIAFVDAPEKNGVPRVGRRYRGSTAPEGVYAHQTLSRPRSILRGTSP